MRALAVGLILMAAPLAAQTAPDAQSYYTLDGHGGPIMAVTVSPSGQVATASFDNSVGLWRGAEPDWLESHDAAVNTVHFADDGTLLSGGDDFALVRWDLASGAATRHEGHKGKVMGLATSPDGTLIATASWDGTIGLWPADTASATAPRFLVGHSGPVNAVAFAAGGSRLFSASADGTLREWDVATGREYRRLTEHGFGINELVLDEAQGWLGYGAVDGGTRILDLASGQTLADLTLDRRPILSMTLSRDGALLAVGDGEGYIMMVDTADWRIAHDFRAAARGPIWALAFSADGAHVHAGGLDNVVHSWPVAALDGAGRVANGDAPFLADPDTMPNGERQFKRKCSICHTLTPGSARRAGPSLFGLFGRQAGTVADYRYSPALTGSDIIWTDATIDALFDEGPAHYIPGTKMPMQRITGSQDRADLIGYLRDSTAPQEN